MEQGKLFVDKWAYRFQNKENKVSEWGKNQFLNE